MSTSIRTLAAILLGSAAFFALADVLQAAQTGLFENPHPTSFARLWPLWSVSLCVLPGIIVALFANRRVPLLSAAAYCIGMLSHFWYHYDEGDIPRRHWDFFQHWPGNLGGLLAVGALGAVIGFAAVILRARLLNQGR
jgi:hypothetical protein